MNDECVGRGQGGGVSARIGSIHPRLVHNAHPEMLHEPPPLRMARLRIELRPRASLRLPVEDRGNVLRGTLGLNLKRAVCDPSCNDAGTCGRRADCAYARLFEPVWHQGARFGANDPPRPFVIRPSLGPDPDFGPRRPLLFELRLFGRAIADAAHFVLPFLHLARTGLAGTVVDVASVLTLDWMGRAVDVLVEDGRVREGSIPALDFEWIWDVPADGPCARIEFITPACLPMRTRSGSRDAGVQAPAMAALARRIRDRLSFLCMVWGDREWSADYGALGDLGDRATLVSNDGGPVTFTRHSSKTRQTMHMTGFCGIATYRDVDAALWPLLRLGQEIHAGRFTEWGLGMYQLVP